MANGLSASSDLDKPAAFECPSCKQPVDLASPQCQFCKASINAEPSGADAAQMARINLACSHASYLKIVVLGVPALFLTAFFPSAESLARAGVLFIEIVIPIWIALWCFRFLSIQSDDPDFRSAKKTVLIIGIVWAVLVGLRFL